jgi:hypothetical protein
MVGPNNPAPAEVQEWLNESNAKTPFELVANEAEMESMERQAPDNSSPGKG